MANQTFYEILGVTPDATMEEIRARYRVLVRQYHPDMVEEGLREAATTLFRTIQAAYDTLNDAALRTAYDASQGRGTVSPRADTTYTTKSDLRDTTENVVCVHCHETIIDTSERCFGSNGQPYHVRCLREVRKLKPIVTAVLVEAETTSGEVIANTENRLKPSPVEFLPIVVWVLVFCLTYYLVVVNARDITELNYAFVLSLIIAVLAALLVPGRWRVRTNPLIDKAIVALSLCITLVPITLTIHLWRSGKIQVKRNAFIFKEKFTVFCGRPDESNLQKKIQDSPLGQKATEAKEVIDKTAKSVIDRAKNELDSNGDESAQQQPTHQPAKIPPIDRMDQSLCDNGLKILVDKDRLLMPAEDRTAILADAAKAVAYGYVQKKFDDFAGKWQRKKPENVPQIRQAIENALKSDPHVTKAISFNKNLISEVSRETIDLLESRYPTPPPPQSLPHSEPLQPSKRQQAPPVNGASPSQSGPSIQLNPPPEQGDNPEGSQPTRAESSKK